MYHKNCLSNYLRTFKRDIEEIINPSLDCPYGIEITKLLQEFLKTINIRNNAYPLSDCREMFNSYLMEKNNEGIYHKLLKDLHPIVQNNNLKIPSPGLSGHSKFSQLITYVLEIKLFFRSVHFESSDENTFDRTFRRGVGVYVPKGQEEISVVFSIDDPSRRCH